MKHDFLHCLGRLKLKQQIQVKNKGEYTAQGVAYIMHSARIPAVDRSLETLPEKLRLLTCRVAELIRLRG